jgi:DNA-binding response OmpR family regulator
MSQEHRPWHGGRILVAEDHFLLGEVTCEFLRHCGLVAVGPAMSVAQGCSLARESALDGAILDLKLVDDLCVPICRILAARRIPFLFLSGYMDLSMIPLEFRSAPLICKPFESNEMKEALSAMLQRNVARDLFISQPSSIWKS